MATRIELFTVTTAAGVQIAAPTITPIPFDIGEVEGIEILVPPGPSGLMGFGIMHGGASVLPREESKWIISDNEPIHWDTQNMPTAGDWSIRSYNLDVFDHSLYFRFLVRDLGIGRPVVVTPLSIVQPEQTTPATVGETQYIPGEAA